MSLMMNVAVLGAGNGGQAMAGYLATQGFNVRLWDRSLERLEPIIIQGGITLTGKLSGFGALKTISTELLEVLQDAQVIMVVTTADAHEDIARRCVPFLQDGQVIVLNPGRTCGAMVFRQALSEARLSARVYVAEAQSLVYACRITGPAMVNVFGVKRLVPLAAMPAQDTPRVLESVQQMYSCFVGARDVIETGLENIGAIFHPAIALLNAVRVEAADSFLFYQTMTPKVSLVVEKLDQERVAVGKAFGLHLTTAKDWVLRSYENVQGDTLYARMRSNPAYDGIEAPTSLESRMFTEDVPTGLVPIAELADLAGVDAHLCRALVDLSSALCQRDFWAEGRTRKRLGIEGMQAQDLVNWVTTGTTSHVL